VPALKLLLLDRHRLVRTTAAGALRGICQPRRQEMLPWLDLRDYQDEGPPRATPPVSYPIRRPEISKLLDLLLQIAHELEMHERVWRRTYWGKLWRKLQKMSRAGQTSQSRP